MTKLRGQGTFFIIGIRRSGTSIVRRLLAMPPEVEKILFEPHDFWHSMMMQHFRRFQGQFHQIVIDNFRPQGKKTIVGAKFALNPGIDALDWRWIPDIYPGAKIIFIARNEADTFASYFKADKDSLRGIVTDRQYSPMFQWLTGSFFDFWQHNQDRSIILNYDNLIKDPAKILAPAWDLLRITPVPKGILKQMIIKPANMGGKIQYEKFGGNGDPKAEKSDPLADQEGAISQGQMVEVPGHDPTDEEIKKEMARTGQAFYNTRELLREKAHGGKPPNGFSSWGDYYKSL